MKLLQLHESLDPHMPQGHCSHKFGDCGIEVLFVVRSALKARFRDFIVVEGMVYIDGKLLPHTWIELRNGEVKDPTLSQFGPGVEIEYSPEGEYREEYSPVDYSDSFEEQYGEIADDI